MQNIIIFSVFRPEFADKNELNHESTIRALNDLGIKTIDAIGMYKGESEKSIVVTYNDYNYDQVVSFAKLFNQESILVVNKHNQAKLVFLNEIDNASNLVQFIGDWYNVPKELAESKDAYTYVTVTKQYYIAE